MVCMISAIESALEVFRPGDTIRVNRRIPFGISEVAKSETNCVLDQSQDRVIKKTE